MKHPIDPRFLALCAFVTIGCLGGWAFIVSNAWIATQDAKEPPIASVSMDGGWEPMGASPDGSEHLRRVASNGDAEGLTILPDGTGLYMRCKSPVTEASKCVKIVLRPRAP